MSVLDLIGNRRLRKIDVIDLITEISHITAIDTITTINEITAIKLIEQANINIQPVRNPFFLAGTNSWLFSGTAVIEDDSYNLGKRVKFPTGSANIIQYCFVNSNLYQVLVAVKKPAAGGDNIDYIFEYTDGTFDTGTFTITGDMAWNYKLTSLTANKVLRRIYLFPTAAGVCYVGLVLLISTIPSLPAGTNNIGDVDVLTLPANGTITHFNKNATGDHITPAAGKALKVWGFFYYADADIKTEVRFKTSGNVIGALATKGSAGMNLISLKLPQGAADEKIEIYLSGVGNAKGWTCTSEV